jgi:ABC-type molybdate transport system substrate-binding protein
MQKSGTYWEIPMEAHPVLEQGAAILKSSEHPEAAKRFLEFMQAAKGQEIMTRYGFTLPQ